MERVAYYVIKPVLTERAPMTLFYQCEKDELYLGAHVRLAGLSGMALISNEGLANQYAEAVRGILCRRYGEGSDVEVIKMVSGSDEKVLKRISRDSEIISKRLATGNFSPNKPVQ